MAALLALQAGCAGPGEPPPPGPLQALPTGATVAFVESFMRKVVASSHEAAFGDVDIQVLVNYGKPQGGLYRALTPGEQKRYRRDFVEGIYSFLFRDLRPAEATWRTVAPDVGSPVVEVTGRPGKTLRLVVQNTPAGLKIVMIERG